MSRGSLEHSSVNRRVLVLGSSGFIGSQLTDALSTCGWATPIAAVHRHEPPPRLQPVITTRLDGCDTHALRQGLRSVDSVVSAITADADTIVRSARALVEACALQSPAPRIVHLSSMMVYGTATGNVGEHVPLKGDWDDYSAAKAEAERILTGYRLVVHLRPGIVYGPGSPIWSGRIGRWLRSGRLGDLGPSGTGYCNLVHVHDVVEAVLRALQLPDIETEAFNLSCPSPPTWNEYFRQYAAALGCPYRRIAGSRLKLERYLFGPPLKLLEVGAARLRLGAFPPPPIRPWLLRLCRHEIRLDVHKAEGLLGMRWKTLRDGLQESADWVLGRREISATREPIA